jgi:GH24 family phage-related lysozyme (muramidase)
MAISSLGLDFVARHEGFVSHAYRDPVGNWTVGTGFTNRSTVAVEMLGLIKRGKTITRAMNERVLAAAFAREYGPPVDSAMPGARQHELDAGYSYSFNCGPAAMGDEWVRLWRAGRKDESFWRLKDSRVTARGKRLQGLVNRRAAEARLLSSGDYGAGAPARDGQADYRAKLAGLGYASVLAFQEQHPNLVADGILGPATRTQIDRALAARREGTAVVIGVGLSAALSQYGPVIAVAAAVAVAGLALWFAARRREEITHWVKDRFE